MRDEDQQEHETVAWLRVVRTDAPPHGYRYAYHIPNHDPFYDDGSVTTRADLNDNLISVATWLRDHASMASGSGGGPMPRGGEESFTYLGNHMSERYLPIPVRDYLFGSRTPLLIETNDPEFPWELVRHEGQFLGVLRPVGRLIPTRRLAPPDSAHWGETRKALLIGDPTQDLPATETEIDAIRGILEGYSPRYQVKPLVGKDASISATERALQDRYEILHLAGHAEFADEHAGESAFSFAGGYTLTADALRHLGFEYAFVYMDVCSGARAAQTNNPELFSLTRGGRGVNGFARGFLEGGASAFISTLWPIMDASASAFTQAVYQQLARGVPFGNALRWAREKWQREHPDDPTWAAYVLYGNPLLTLATVRDPQALAPKEMEHVAPDSRVTFGYSGVHGQARFRSARVEQFFRRFIGDESLSLDPSGEAAIESTLGWVDQMTWHVIARLDLFVGLARVPGGRAARGLRALGVTPERLSEIDTILFGRGPRKAEQPDVSSGVARTLMRAAMQAKEQGRQAVTEDDLAQALLSGKPTGTIQRALDVLGIDGADILAAAPAATVADSAVGAAPLESLPPRPPVGELIINPSPEPAREKKDVTPRHILRDLHDEVKTLQRHGKIPPLIGRNREFRDLLRILSGPGASHAVIRGAAGVGVYSLAYAIAVKQVTDPDAAEISDMSDWPMYEVRVQRDSPQVSAWLRREIESLPGSAILLLDDLPALLRFPGLVETLRDAFTHPNLRCVATAYGDSYRMIHRDYPDLSRLLTPLDLTEPRPEVAETMTQAHRARLENKYTVTITADAMPVAVEVAHEEPGLALPGSAIARLERACARKVGSVGPIGHAESAGMGDNATVDGSPPPATGVLTTRQSPVQPERPLVTASDVRAATPTSSTNSQYSQGGV
ncbi:MAG TPA: CHAT domain-containing protein [Ktedonobacterales bacterium]|nr:CHAT domain-containing protein [Ktedonobacterales bacterium]